MGSPQRWPARFLTKTRLHDTYLEMTERPQVRKRSLAADTAAAGRAPTSCDRAVFAPDPRLCTAPRWPRARNSGAAIAGRPGTGRSSARSTGRGAGPGIRAPWRGSAVPEWGRLGCGKCGSRDVGFGERKQPRSAILTLAKDPTIRTKARD